MAIVAQQFLPGFSHSSSEGFPRHRVWMNHSREGARSVITSSTIRKNGVQGPFKRQAEANHEDSRVRAKCGPGI